MVTSVSRLAYHAPTRETVPRLLTRHTHLIEESLRLAALPPASPLGRMCGYHMGWLDADGSPRDASRGKLIRPSLCVWACESLSAPASQALPAAVALELIHNFTLVHDDIQDGDARRRHRPSVWTVWGQAQGINAGDGLFALAYTSLLARGAHPSRRLKAGEVISRAVLEVINGQCLDLTLEGRLDTSPAAYMRMVSAKTGALLGASLEAGAVLAGASARVARSFRRAGRLLGLAFQIRDDWLGVWGDPALTGKGKESDLGRRKITYPLVAAYARAPASLRRELRRLYREREGNPVLPWRRGEVSARVDGQPVGSGDREQEIRSVLEQVGGPGLTADVPASLARRAVDTLRDGERLGKDALDEFAELAMYVAERER